VGAGHSHGGSSQLVVPSQLTRWLTAVAAVIGLVAVIGMVVLWPSGDLQSSITNVSSTFVDGRIVAAEEVPCPGQQAEGAPQLLCAELDVEVLEGADAGLLVPLDVYDAASADLSVGDVIVLEYDEASPAGFQYRFSDRERSTPMVALVVLFAVVVVLLGRWRGLAALVGLGMSLGVLLVFTVPALIEGSDPLSVALVSATVIAFAGVYLAHGFNSMSTVALLGTLGALAITALLALVFVGAAAITGLASEEAVYLQLGPVRLGLAGLVLAGIVIGALGAIDDMTVTQASAVWELRATGGRTSPMALYRSGIRIGRDHVASTVNTLVLAYAGASMPLLLFFSLSNQSWLVVANGELVATEIVRTLVGSIGLVASVPLTTALAAWVAHRAEDPGGDDHHHVEDLNA